MAFGNGGTSIDPLELLHILHPTVQAQTLVFITKHLLKLLMIEVLITQILQEIRLNLDT